ncbi:MAG: hypothetical protein E7349_07220 [Clostridiales bacterium]|nr:hypothetical protein [Clostridiales bacterium]
MEKEKVLSTLWSLRAGLSIISMQKDKTDKCAAIIEDCEHRPSQVDKKLKEELSHKKNLYKLEQECATHKFSFWGDILRPLLKTSAWMILLVCSTLLFAAPALACAGLSIYTLFAEYHEHSVLMFIGGLVGFGALGIGGVALILWIGSRLWENVTFYMDDLKFPWKVKKDKVFAIERMIPHYQKQIQELEEQIRKQEEGISSAKPTIQKKKEEIIQLSNTSSQLYKALVKQYGMVLDIRDWQHLDLIIFYFETGRADSLKEALQLVDRQVQTNTIVNAIYSACTEICNTIKINTDRLGALMAEGMLAISSQISDLKATQLSQMKELIDSQTMLVALQKKSNQNSMQLMEDCRYLTTLAEQGEIRRRNNA